MISSAIFSRLNGNEELIFKLARVKDTDVPAIYKVWADEDSEFPYVVYRLTENKGFQHPYKSEFVLYIDVWDYNEHTMKPAGDISDILKLEFNNKMMKHPKYGAMQSWLTTRAEMQENTRGINHIAHQFTIHAWDKEI